MAGVALFDQGVARVDRGKVEDATAREREEGEGEGRGKREGLETRYVSTLRFECLVQPNSDNQCQYKVTTQDDMFGSAEQSNEHMMTSINHEHHTEMPKRLVLLFTQGFESCSNVDCDSS